MEYLSAEQLWNMGVDFVLKNKPSEAMLCFERALDKDPGLAVAWDSKGGVLTKLGRHQEAIRCFDRALEIDPRLASAWLNKGMALIGLDRKEEATECFRRAADMEPKITELLRRAGFL